MLTLFIPHLLAQIYSVTFQESGGEGGGGSTVEEGLSGFAVSGTMGYKVLLETLKYPCLMLLSTSWDSLLLAIS